MNDIDRLEEIIVEYAGPIAKYVLKAEIRRMGYSRNNFPKDKLPELARRVIKAAITDPGWREICLRRVYREILR